MTVSALPGQGLSPAAVAWIVVGVVGGFLLGAAATGVICYCYNKGKGQTVL